MNTKIAQTFVGNGKTSKIKLGLMSLLFTFVFMGMGVTSQAQSLSTKGSSLNTTLLDGKTFKVEKAQILDDLMMAKRDLAQSNADEIYIALATNFIDGITHKVKNTTLSMRDAVYTSYVDVVNFSKNFKSPDAQLQAAAEDVLKLFN